MKLRILTNCTNLSPSLNVSTSGFSVSFQILQLITLTGLLAKPRVKKFHFKM